MKELKEKNSADQDLNKDTEEIKEGNNVEKKSQESERESKIKKWRKIILEAIAPKKREKSENKKKKEKEKRKDKTVLSKPKTEVPTFTSVTYQKRDIKKIISLIVLGIVALLISFLIIIASGVYFFKLNDNFTKKITKVIPFPAALIKTECGWEMISYNTFINNTETLSYFYQRRKEENPDIFVPSQEEIKRNVLEKNMINKIAQCLAQKEGIKVTQGEVDQEMEKIIIQIGSIDKAKEVIHDLYKWDIEDFKNQVLSPYILKTKLQVLINKDEEINKSIKEKAEMVLKQVKENPKKFSLFAQEYSEDFATKQLGGDLNWVKKGQLPPELETAAFNLKVGTTSDLITSNDGYHILKILDKKTDEEGIEKVRLAHILIRFKDIEEELEKYLQESKVYYFVK